MKIVMCLMAANWLEHHEKRKKKKIEQNMQFKYNTYKIYGL